MGALNTVAVWHREMLLLEGVVLSSCSLLRGVVWFRSANTQLPGVGWPGRQMACRSAVQIPKWPAAPLLSQGPFLFEGFTAPLPAVCCFMLPTRGHYTYSHHP